MRAGVCRRNQNPRPSAVICQRYKSAVHTKESIRLPVMESKNIHFVCVGIKDCKGKINLVRALEGGNGDIHFYQIEGLEKLNSVGNCVCGFIIEFREIEKTIFLNIKDFMKLSDMIEKKSFTISDLDSNNIPYVVIEQRLMKTNSKYNVEDFLKVTAVNYYRRLS